MIDNKLYANKQEEYFFYDRKELLEFVPHGIKTVLDVGCGAGKFGELLKNERSLTVWGIEYDVYAADKARNVLDKVIRSDFDSALPYIGSRRFDLICFNDVLEHLVNPVEVLIKCRTLLNTDGYITASIPNVRWYPVILSLLRYKDFKYQEAGVMDKSHLRFFTKKSMVRLFEDAGFEVQRIEGINKSKFKYFDLFNKLLFNTQSDMTYPQFAIVSKIKNE